MNVAQDNHRLLIVGYGSAGRRHARNLRQLGWHELLFLRSSRPTAIDEAPPPGDVVHTMAQAISSAPLAAIIATPSALHLDAALPLADAGCHLFIEKPIAEDRDLERCERLVNIARTKNLVTMIGYPFRFHPLLCDLRERLQNNRLGEPIAVRAEWGEYLPDWHPGEDYRQSYAARVELGGGVLLTLIHPLDYLLWLFGEVADVRAICRKLPVLSTNVPDDWADLTLRFCSGVVGHVHLDYIQKPPVHRLSIWATRGHADVDFHQGTLTLSEAGVTHHVSVPLAFSRNDMFLDEMRHFLRAVDGGHATDIPVEEGVRALRLVARARRDAGAHGDPDSSESRFQEAMP